MKKRSKQSKYLAGFSLGVMGTGFLATLPFVDYTGWQLLQGGFEAGLVGGLADWFAVTALFRHPLGVKIPHTALLPKNRDKLTNTLVNMLENEWLTKDSIKAKIKDVKFTEKLVNIIEREIGTKSVKNGAISVIKKIIHHVDVEKVSPFIEKEIKNSLSSINTAKVLQMAANELVERNYDEKALDFVLSELKDWAEKEDSRIKMGTMAVDLLNNTEGDGFFQFAIQSFRQFINKEKLGTTLQSFVLKRIGQLQKENNPYRQIILKRIQTEMVHLEEREQLVRELNGWKDKMIGDWHLTGQIADILERMRHRILLFIEEDQFYDQYLFPFFKKMIEELKDDSRRINLVEEWIQQQIILLIEKNHSKIGNLVRENLDRLDTKTLIAMMENNVGKDLQWIRVNGAVCGFLIGIVLTAVKTFF